MSGLPAPFLLARRKSMAGRPALEPGSHPHTQGGSVVCDLGQDRWRRRGEARRGTGAAPVAYQVGQKSYVVLGQLLITPDRNRPGHPRSARPEPDRRAVATRWPSRTDGWRWCELRGPAGCAREKPA